MEDIVGLLVALVNALPPPARAVVINLLGVALLVCSAKALFIKAYGPLDPSDPEWKKTLFRYTAWTDVLQVFGPSFRAQLILSHKEGVIRDLAMKVPPPSVPPPPWAEPVPMTDEESDTARERLNARRK